MSQQIFLALDGELTKLPFEILPSYDGRYLIDNYYCISYLSTGRDLVRINREHSSKPAKSIVVSDPDFDLGVATSSSECINGNRNRGELLQGLKPVSELHATKISGERIASLLDAKHLTGNRALKVRIKYASSPYILHIYTHGIFKPVDYTDVSGASILGPQLMGAPFENPLLRSFVVLAGFNTFLNGGATPPEAENGFLTAEDVSGMDLSSTEMVVLAACVTGLGEVHVGTGVVGLQRSVMLAGAKTLIMSLWNVDVLATVILMQRFYENLTKCHLERNESLHEARIYVRDLTVGKIRKNWFSDEMIEKLSGNNEEMRDYLQRLKGKDDHYQPFKKPYFWGAWLCLGNHKKINFPIGNGKENVSDFAPIKMINKQRRETFKPADIQVMPNSNIKIAANHYQKGVSLFELGQFEEALKEYDLAISFYPNYIQAKVNKVAILSHIGRFQEALDECDKILEQHPDEFVIHYNRGLVLSELGRNHEALASFEKAILDPGNSIARLNRFATVWRKSGVMEYADLSDERLFQDRLAAKGRKMAEIEEEMRIRGLINDRSLEAFNQGNQRVWAGHFSWACKFFRKAIAISPRYLDAYANLGGCLIELGELKEAHAILEKGRKIGTTSDLLNNLGRVKQLI